MVDVEEKRDSIIATVVTEVEDLCNCGFGAGGIDAASSGFQCSRVSNAIIFRARLFSNVRVTASDLIFYITQWVSEGVSILVQGLIFEIDPECTVEIQSLSDPECQVPTDDSNDDEFVLIIVGVVVFIVAVITVSLALIFILVHRRRHNRKLPSPSR